MADDIFDVRDRERASSSWRQLQDLIADAARVQTRWAKAVATTARSAGRGEVAATGDLLKSVGSEYQRYLRDVGELNVKYARALQELATASGERFSDAVEDATRAERSAEPARKPAGPGASATRTSAVRKTAKRTTAKKTTAKKATAKKATAKKATAKRPARARRTPPARG